VINTAGAAACAAVPLTTAPPRPPRRDAALGQSSSKPLPCFGEATGERAEFPAERLRRFTLVAAFQFAQYERDP